MCIYAMACKFYLKENVDDEKPELGPLLELAPLKSSYNSVLFGLSEEDRKLMENR